MEVKIYREPENENLIINEDDLKEYNDLAIELGLAIRSADDLKVPNVYMPLNNATQRQLKALCPESAKIEAYKKSTIPLEVLKVYKYAKENEMFDGYSIWYDDEEPDPLLIGWNWQSKEARKNAYTWQVNRFLIARWGDCALELSELLEKGKVRIKAQLLDKAKIIQDKVSSVINNPDSYVNKIISGTSITGHDFNLNTNADGTIHV